MLTPTTTLSYRALYLHLAAVPEALDGRFCPIVSFVGVPRDPGWLFFHRAAFAFSSKLTMFIPYPVVYLY